MPQLTAGRRCNRPTSAHPLRDAPKPRIRPASASQGRAAGAGAAGNLREVSLALSNDLEKWQRQWDLALQAVGDLRCSVTSVESTSELVPQLLARRQSGLSAQLALVEERLGVALTQAQHTRAQASALHQLQAKLEQSKQAQTALYGRASAASAAATQQQERASAELRVLAGELRRSEQELAGGASETSSLSSSASAASSAASSTAAAAQAVSLRARVREAASLRDEVRHWQAVAQEEAARRFEVLGELNGCKRELAALRRDSEAARQRAAEREERQMGRRLRGSCGGGGGGGSSVEGLLRAAVLPDTEAVAVAAAREAAPPPAEPVTRRPARPATASVLVRPSAASGAGTGASHRLKICQPSADDAEADTRWESWFGQRSQPQPQWNQPESCVRGVACLPSTR
tara:strand:- start:11 stop:1222 length:1212 start_codon:yes stop_codon:yes gene_type:complete